MKITSFQKADYQKALLNWFQKNKRDMPWRRTRDPYAIWISEVMLQQTQVISVIPYYNRFLKAFPTIETLAGADLQKVLKVWEGLGYYARARNLQKAAKIIVAQFKGKFPDNPQEVAKLPGIGRYTMGAILSIAFGKSIPVLDGNAARVLSRLLLFEEPVTKPQAKEKLWAAAEILIPDKEPAQYNQALMELGAVVCTPKTPLCGKCPLQPFCRANFMGRQAEIPVREKRKKVPYYHVSAGIIWRDGKILITLRPTNKMLGGLWEFPGGKCEEGESYEECLLREVAEELSIRIKVEAHVLDVRHAYTHFKITLHTYRCKFMAGEPVLAGADDFRWVAP
ncbi:MAG TPA: A/G-specific adenine glycosylase, partial [Bacteroidetes bacterium]|nr:A/G-specific adenine glycosylase [Bacteroidota bacterium]